MDAKLTTELPLTLASRRGRLDGGWFSTSAFNSDIYKGKSNT